MPTWEAQYERSTKRGGILRNVLIDNSTVTAVDRIMGNVPLNSYYQVDGNIAALESFIQAILFSDDVLCVDDYRSDLTLDRKNRYPFIHWISRQAFDLTFILRSSVR